MYQTTKKYASHKNIISFFFCGWTVSVLEFYNLHKRSLYSSACNCVFFDNCKCIHLINQLQQKKTPCWQWRCFDFHTNLPSLTSLKKYYKYVVRWWCDDTIKLKSYHVLTIDMSLEKPKFDYVRIVSMNLFYWTANKSSRWLAIWLDDLLKLNLC